TVHDGDRLLLGDPKAPVTLAVRFRASAAAPREEKILAARPITELGAVEGKVQADPVGALALYQASKRIGGRLDLADTLEAVAAAVIEMIPRATHVVLFWRTEGDDERFTVIFSRAAQPGTPSAPVRASRAVLRRVLADRAAVLIADAASELGSSES